MSTEIRNESPNLSKRVHCFSPWYTLMINIDGFYGPCCTIGRLPNQNIPRTKNELMQLWNSASMVAIRKSLVDGKIQGTKCTLCDDHYFSTDHDILGMGKNFPIRSKNKSKEYQEYYKHANSAYVNGDVVLDYTPLELYVFTSRKCNLRCAMCPFTPGNNYHAYDNILFPVDKLKSLVKEIGWDHIDRFGFIGGEPLLTKDAIEILNFLATEKLNGTCIYITTNGMLIDAQIDLLKKINNLFITISVDGIGEIYERIRVNAKWDKLVSNLMLLAKVKEKERPNWKININSIVMKSTIPYLLDILKLGQKAGATVFFSSITETGDENMFLDPSLLNKIPNWRECIDSTLEHAKRTGATKSYDSLSVVKNKIEVAIANEKKSPLLYKKKIAAYKIRQALRYCRHQVLKLKSKL